MQSSRNIASRAGRWSAQHRKTAILGWIVFVVLAFAVGGKVGTKTLTKVESGVGESGTADRIVDDAYPERVDEMVLVQSEHLKAGDPRFRAVVHDLGERAGGRRGRHLGLRSVRRGPRRLGLAVPRRRARERSRSPAILRARRSRRPSTRRWPPSTAPRRPIRTCGSRSSATGAPTRRSRRSSTTDLKQGGHARRCRSRCSILLIAFGALVAAGRPAAARRHRRDRDDRAGRARSASWSRWTSPISARHPADRPRRRRRLLALLPAPRARGARGRPQHDARRSRPPRRPPGARCSISGPHRDDRDGRHVPRRRPRPSPRSRPGTIIVVAVAMLGSLTVLPALLSLLGDRVEKGRVPFLGPPQGAVRRAPRPVVARSSTASCAARCSPASLPTALLAGAGDPGARACTSAHRRSTTLPAGPPRSCRRYDRIQAAFPGGDPGAASSSRPTTSRTPAVTRGDRRAGAARRSPSPSSSPERRRA